MPAVLRGCESENRGYGREQASEWMMHVLTAAYHYGNLVPRAARMEILMQSRLLSGPSFHCLRERLGSEMNKREEQSKMEAHTSSSSFRCTDLFTTFSATTRIGLVCQRILGARRASLPLTDFVLRVHVR